MRWYFGLKQEFSKSMFVLSLREFEELESALSLFRLGREEPEPWSGVLWAWTVSAGVVRGLTSVHGGRGL